MKKIVSGNELKEGISKGVNLIGNTVRKTLGSKGRYVGIYNAYGRQYVTKDGVTVAANIQSEDLIEDFAIQIIKESAQKTADEVGDGTTTTTLFAQEIYNAGIKEILNGQNAIELRESFTDAYNLLEKYIKSESKAIKPDDIKMLEKVATISANNDSVLGKRIAEIFTKITQYGSVNVEEQRSATDVEYSEGFEIEGGYMSHYFINDDSSKVILKDPIMIVTDQKITNLQIVASVIDPYLKNQHNSFVIVCPEIDPSILASFVRNRMEAGLNICVVKAPSYGQHRKELLEDLCALSGATLMSLDTNKDINKILSPEHTGTVSKFIGDVFTSTYVTYDKSNPEVQKRIDQIKIKLKDVVVEEDKKRLEERLAKLSAGVATIKVGAASEIEAKEIKDRIDDAVKATRSALKGGISKGAGIAYLESIKALEKLDNLSVKKILTHALAQPSIQILENVNVKPDYSDIYDPTDVVLNAIKNSISVSLQLLMTEALVINKDEIQK